MRVHRAGQPIEEPGDDERQGGPVQRCQDCGEVLQDYRGAMVMLEPGTERGERLTWWPAGAHVLVDGNCWSRADAAEAQAFACTKSEAQG